MGKARRRPIFSLTHFKFNLLAYPLEGTASNVWFCIRGHPTVAPRSIIQKHPNDSNFREIRGDREPVGFLTWARINVTGILFYFVIPNGPTSSN